MEVSYDLLISKRIQNIAPGQPLTVFSTSPLPAGSFGTAYGAALVAGGGTGPYTWTLTAGTLPTGVTLSPNGLLSGTPLTAGNFTASFLVTDSAAATVAFNNATIAISSTAFSDIFVRSVLGPNWRIGYFDNTQASLATISIFVDGSGDFKIGNSGGGGTNANIPIWAMPSQVFQLNGLTQYAELKWVSGAGNDVVGPSVATTGQVTQGPDPMNGYLLGIRTSLNRLDLNYSNAAETLIQANVSAFAVGDTARISVTFGNPNSLNIYRNGTLVTTITDANAGRPTTGLPCIVFAGAVAGAVSHFSAFSCGFGA